jgi:hypothetical protein
MPVTVGTVIPDGFDFIAVKIKYPVFVGGHLSKRPVFVVLDRVLLAQFAEDMAQIAETFGAYELP